jgi:U3 small nucleolar RNA-associated protein 21
MQDVGSSITAMAIHRDSGLISVVCDDLVIRLVDVETRRIVRELRGFKGRILDTVSSQDYHPDIRADRIRRPSHLIQDG